jgi:hypothetical protein
VEEFVKLTLKEDIVEIVEFNSTETRSFGTGS